MTYYADIGNTILLYVMLGVSLNLLVGYSGQISLAHGALYGIGAYTAGLLMVKQSWSLAPALLASIATTFLFAAVISVPALRVSGEYFILLTLAFNMVIQQLLVSLIGFTGGLDGLYGVPPLKFFSWTLTSPIDAFWPLLAITAIVVALVWRIAASSFGRVLKGIREDELAVRALGRPTPRYKLLTFGLTAGIAGLAGALNASYYQFIAPGSYTLDLSIFVLAIVVLGGSASILGSIVGAIVLGILPPVLQHAGLSADNTIVWQNVLYGLALVAFMRFRPEGIVPERTQPRSRLASSLAPLWRKHTFDAYHRGGGDHTYEPLSILPRRIHGSEVNEGAVVRVTELAKRFGGVEAVKDVDLTLARRRITALVGPNGAGKTTIFNLITGIARPDHGRIVVGAVDVTGKSIDRITQMGLARSFQDVRVFRRLTVLENVAMAIPAQRREHPSLGLRPLAGRRPNFEVRTRAAAYIEFVGLKDSTNTLVGSLSFAEQKLVALARLLATECEVLLLDEPMSGLDPTTVRRMIEIVLRLRDIGRTICIIEHSLHVIEQVADHVYFLEQGRVTAEGSIADLMSQPRLVEAYFGA